MSSPYSTARSSGSTRRPIRRAARAMASIIVEKPAVATIPSQSAKRPWRFEARGVSLDTKPGWRYVVLDLH